MLSESNFDVMTERSMDIKLSGNLTTFCKNLVRHSQIKFKRILYCGSRMENPTHLLTAQLSSININKMDMDKMVYFISQCAMSCTKSVPEEFTGTVIRIYSEDSHPGYVTLMKEKDNTELLWSECIVHVQGKDEQRHGPAVLSSPKEHTFDTDYNLSSPTVNEIAFKKLAITPQDLVYAMHNPYWPLEAAEWVTRNRSQNIPSTRLIKQIVRYGCDFVPVSHKLCVCESNEWRFSFSKAELLIIKSWNMPQRNAYTVLWLMNKNLEGSHMCTYYFKTLMLWACEEKSSEFWKEDHCALVHSVRELIIYMMTCLKSKYLPNYFIPANNMMDHLNDIDVLPDIHTLFTEIKGCDTLKRLKVSSGVLKSANTTCFELPSWIKRSFIIYDRINNEEDNFSDLYSSTFQEVVLNALRVELSDVHQSLRFQKQFASCDDTSEKEKYFTLAVFHLERAFSQCKFDEMDTMENCNHTFVRTITNAFCSQEIGLRQITLKQLQSMYTGETCATGLNEVLESISIRNQKPLICSVETVHFVQDKWTFTRPLSVSYSLWPGVSPTVSISWFIAKAYLANFYYTTHRKITAAIEICDEIITVYKDTYQNERFAERTFPVVMSTQWASLYDKEIQVLVGFYSLCEYILSEEQRRTVYLGVCPVQYALYLKLRIHWLLRDVFYHQFHYAVVDKTNIGLYLAHMRGCKFDCKYNNPLGEKIESGGRLLLYCALGNYRVGK